MYSVMIGCRVSLTSSVRFIVRKVPILCSSSVSEHEYSDLVYSSSERCSTTSLTGMGCLRESGVIGLSRVLLKSYFYWSYKSEILRGASLAFN